VATARKRMLSLLPPSVLGRLRAWRVRQIVAAYVPRVVEHTYGDGRLHVHLGDPLGQGWYDHDWAQLPEITALRGGSLRNGARVFDIGAHQGVVAMMLAREVGPTGRVLAAEPNPHNAAVALKNRDLNSMAQIEVLEAAVSDHSGTVVFNHGLDGQLDDGTGAGGRMSVACVTLNELAQRHGTPDFVMIDVEGAECRVLKGGSRVLQAGGVDFAVEVHVHHGLEKLGGSVAEVLSFFPADRFDVTARAEADTAFRPLNRADPLIRDRFFLLAKARK
jgi:FkbM family methyltransferase